MGWIRFGRNERPAPAGPLLDRDAHPLDLRAYADGCALLIFFAPPSGLTGCATLLADLRAVDEAEPDAGLLIVTAVRADSAAHPDLPLAYDEGGELVARYRALTEVDMAGQAVLFVLDRDGGPVYAWHGACDNSASPGEAGRLRDELARRLQSAAFLCPECSVPDPGASALWDVVY